MHQIISKGLLIVLAVLLVASCSLEEPTRTGRLDKGDKAPKWTGIDLVSGQQKSFPGILNDKPAVLVFWATWCPYCKAFMPYAGQIQAEFAEHDVQIITFNAKERGEGDPKAYVDSLQFPLTAIADADSIAESYDVKFIPGLMVVNGEGMVTYRRGWTDLPAGSKVATFWADEVRAALNETLGIAAQ
ncbi:MAG: TlpA disulfide reductase family protein [Halioglobus sp.]